MNEGGVLKKWQGYSRGLQICFCCLLGQAFAFQCKLWPSFYIGHNIGSICLILVVNIYLYFTWESRRSQILTISCRNNQIRTVSPYMANITWREFPYVSPRVVVLLWGLGRLQSLSGSSRFFSLRMSSPNRDNESDALALLALKSSKLCL